MNVQRCRIAIAHRRRVVRERTRLTNALNNIVLRFGHTVGAHAATGSHALGGKLKGGTIWPIFEDLADGKLPAMPGVRPVPMLLAEAAVDFGAPELTSAEP